MVSFMNFIVLESNQFETHIFPSASHTLTYLESMDLFEHWNTRILQKAVVYLFNLHT